MGHWPEEINVVVIAAIAAVLQFFKLGEGALQDWDEAIHAEVSKEIVTSHHWLSLYWQHEPYFRKPPLSFWIRAAFFQWFGVTEFWARFASAAAGAAIVVLAYVIARRLFGASAGFCAGIVLLTTRHFEFVTRQGSTDALLCLCIYLAVYAYLRLLDGSSKWYYALCAAVGIGAMVKGPAILIAPLAIVVDACIRKERRILLNWRRHCLGGLLMLAIVAPWHLWMIVHYGRSFVDEYLGHQIVGRATRVLENSGGGPNFYIGAFFDLALPWSLLAIVAAARWIQRREYDFSLFWTLAGVTLAVYTLIPTKHEWYILPIYPAMAIEVGRFLHESGQRRRLIQYCIAAVLVVMLGTTFAKLAMSDRSPFEYKKNPIANEMAQMSGLARNSSSNAPILVISQAGTDPELAAPTAAFYSERHVARFQMPGDQDLLDTQMANGDSADAIIEKSATFDLIRRFDVHSIAENDRMVYAIISRKR
jgi:4-amino-4-deoxy-L-arabinose transferase-like glycosyltransferase